MLGCVPGTSANKKKVSWWGCWIAFACFWCAAVCFAKQHGITSVSGLQGGTCADSCHGDEEAPVLVVEGPRAVAPGTLVSWRLAMRPATSRALGGGVNIAATAGELVPEAGLYLDFQELTHVAPARSADANGDGAVSAADVVENVRSRLTGMSGNACIAGDANGDGVLDEADTQAVAGRIFGGGYALLWEFRWIAPLTSQEVEFFAAGVAANCNGTRGGDGVGTIRWEVSVVSAAERLRGW